MAKTVTLPPIEGSLEEITRTHLTKCLKSMGVIDHNKEFIISHVVDDIKNRFMTPDGKDCSLDAAMNISPEMWIDEIFFAILHGVADHQPRVLLQYFATHIKFDRLQSIEINPGARNCELASLIITINQMADKIFRLAAERGSVQKRKGYSHGSYTVNTPQKHALHLMGYGDGVTTLSTRRKESHKLTWPASLDRVISDKAHRAYTDWVNGTYTR